MEMKKLLESLEECGMQPMGGAPAQQGSPVSINVSLNASGKEHVEDLLNMMKNAGLTHAQPAADAMMPMRMDMERLRDIVDEPEMEADDGPKEPKHPQARDYYQGGGDEEDEEDLEEFDNEPEVEYQDQNFMTKDLAGGINKSKKSYAKAEDGDNPMAVEGIKARLMAALSEKKSKPDFLDVDKDGDKKEPMKKAIADKKKGTVKEGKKYGSKERGEKVAGAVLAKLRKS
jgi:hypothetical protein